MEAQNDSSNKAERRLDKSTLIWVVLGVIIVGIAGINLWSVFDTKSEVPVSKSAVVSVPDFSLTDQRGQMLGLSDMKGKIWVADFIFTNCPTICPAMTQEMARLQSEFVADPVYFVSFSVDPERDTSAVLSRYAKAYGADERRWHFLTGDKGHIYQLAEEGFSLAAGHKGTELLHSTRFVLVAPDGNIYGYYDSRSKPALLRLRRDVNALLKQ
ncbi:MAG: SCO family protein [Candidatus Poribacteria bacterium]|nr:SCO family protein [Candidatus Poribacteria bacterium]MDD9972716.1 SCO family protein [Candidatus Poribacteria bacterium]MDE0322971.1 SCO family protein [Candidatus Poribacteria bacterium]